ncbi:DEAD/DEAH box helicase [Naegleria gruberi]|uniref:Probable eukaryotic initiation factor 4A n=1 Tax=Naegleria gruberi TaxID=5762 RepID=D2VEC4_NAEGR|nr:DEAD/DEAH box helicase [Naegleria gruberi]EFC44772.1 DEAD/DEAH box helicase [Naegleria gruberi]|eukprot:XP_002677516.1 DEAD/DEAH box helicase [Naegleria gruberi strain NEG-M]
MREQNNYFKPQQSRYQPYDRNGGGSGGYNNQRGGGGGRYGGDNEFRNDRGPRSFNDNEASAGPAHIREDEPEEDLFNKRNTGINFEKYENIPIEVFGRDPPTPLATFEEADLHELLMTNVKKSGYTKPTPIQKHSMPAIVTSKRDMMACAQTGSGKTAAFLLPIINALLKSGIHKDKRRFAPNKGNPKAVILAPTRELCQQIYDECRKFIFQTYLKTVVVYGGASSGYQMKQLERGVDILVGTPGRMNDFIQREKLDMSGVQYLVLDEADRMLDMGFEPQIRSIVEGSGMPPKGDRLTLLYSATFPKETQKLALDFLHDELFVQVGIIGGTTDNITQSFYQVDRRGKQDKLVEVLTEKKEEREKTLVFVQQKSTCDRIYELLTPLGFKCSVIHGDKDQRSRERSLRQFKDGYTNILVATDVAARGLDIEKVAHVINYDLPKEIDSYIHRIGRTGRVGNLGIATAFFDPSEDGKLCRELVKILKDANQEIPEFIENAAYNPFGGRGDGGFRRGGGGFRGGRGGGRGGFGGGFNKRW